WMRTQKRAFPLKEIGRDGGGGPFGTEFCTMRAEDNRFYWLGVKDISAKCLTSVANWKNTASPAAITARIDQTANTVYVKTQGIGQVTVLLGRSPRGEMMVDFERPVNVQVNVSTMLRKKVSPSLGVLLEELATRGDRKHLYLARIDVNLR